MKIVWTEEARRLVTPRSADDVGPCRTPIVEAAWAEIRTRREIPLPRAEPAIAHCIEAAASILRTPAAPSHVDVEAFAALFVWLIFKASDNVLELAWALEGLPRAFEVFLRAHAFVIRHQNRVWSFVPSDDQRTHYQELVLRRALLRADPDTHATCLAIAKTAWPTAALGLRVAIAHCFPGERAWGREVARAWIDAGFGNPPLRVMFANLDDADLAAKLFERRATSTSMVDLVAWLGEDAYPIILGGLRAPRDPYDLKQAAVAAALFESEEVASLFAKQLSKVQARAQAVVYFQRFPALAHAALDTLSKKKTRVAMMAQGILDQSDRVREDWVGTTSIPDAEEATMAELPLVLARPPWKATNRPSRRPSEGLFDCPKSVPKMPPFWKPEAFTRPLLKNGKALPLAAVQALGEMLTFSVRDTPYAGITDVREACEPRSLAEFAWDIAQAWEIAGARNPSVWMLHALSHFADDEVTRRTTPAIKDPRILDVLGRIGTDAAAMELATIAANAMRTPSPDITSANRAERLFADVARRQGITKDELEDRIAVTSRLDGRVKTTLDLGSRTFQVTFTSSLEPIAIDAEGRRFKAFPAKKKTDDAAKVKLAMARWNELREDVATIAQRRIASLERAMVFGRTWVIERFLQLWIESPIFLFMAQAVVWSVGDTTFRVAEDRSFVNEHDEPIVLLPGTNIGVAHVLRLSPETRARWVTIFADYELIQPLSQLDRLSQGSYVLEEADREKTEIVCKRATPIAPRPLADLLRQRGFEGTRRPFVVTRRLTTPQYSVEVVFESTLVDAMTLRFRAGSAAIPVSALDPVDVFELLRDVEMSNVAGL